MADFSPNALRAIAQGLRAQSQLQGLETGPQMRQAINQMETPYGEVQGNGFAAEAPGLLNMLATTAMQRQGQQRVKGIDARANVLRGEIAQGAIAQQQQAMQQAEIERQQKEAARLAQNEAIGKREAENIRLRASLTPQPQGPADSFNNEQYVSPDGKSVNVAINRRTGKGYLDGEEITNFSQYKKAVNEKKGTSGGYASVIKEALPHIETIKGTENIRNIANSFSPQDEADLDMALAQVIKDKITPDSLKVYVQNNLLDISDTAKKYLLAVDSLAAKVRHHLSGSAYTPFEGRLNNTFLSNAQGLTIKDRMRRIGTMHDEAFTGLQSLDEGTNGQTAYSTKYAPWQEWAPPSETKKTAPVSETEKIKQQLDALEKELNGAKVVN